MTRSTTDVDRLRYERERVHHDARFAGGERVASQYYGVNRAGAGCYRDAVTVHAAPTVLEYGCGTGSLAFDLAERGMRVTGIDISGVAVRQARAQSLSATTAPAPTFVQTNAEHLGFADSSFDLVCGSGILHHLDLELAIAEIARVLRPGGRAVFFEPLGHNPALNLYRRLTPGDRTPDEHPLLLGDIDGLDQHFDNSRTRYFALATLLAVPLRRTSPFERVLARLEAVDRWMFTKVPASRRFAWTAVIELGAPREKPPEG